MKLVKSSYKIIEQEPGINGIYKMIEYAGRVSYKSENKITEESAKPFIDRLIRLGHYSPLESGTVYLAIPWIDIDDWEKYKSNPYSKYDTDSDFSTVAITTNYRVLIENGWLEDLKYLCEPTEYHAKRATVKFILPIAISREFCRHRKFSFMEQSTRYCNFSSNKFNNEIEFIEDNWTDKSVLKAIEDFYINSPLKAEEKRNILPLCTKTELIMTGYISDFKHFFELRDNNHAHPQARELAHSLHEEFINKKYLNNNTNNYEYSLYY